MKGVFKPAAALAVMLWSGAAEAATEAKRIGWQELRPPRPAATVTDTGSGQAGTPGETLMAGLEGESVALKGFLLPVDREGDLVYEFLLVSWPGACSHMAQPPPNQVVHVYPEKPYRASAAYEPVEISGTMRVGLEKTQLFILDGAAVVESGYRVGKAKVTKTAGPAQARKSNPWSFLGK